MHVLVVVYDSVAVRVVARVVFVSRSSNALEVASSSTATSAVGIAATALGIPSDARSGSVQAYSIQTGKPIGLLVRKFQVRN